MISMQIKNDLEYNIMTIMVMIIHDVKLVNDEVYSDIMVFR